MDFFSQQDKARRYTGLLVFYFVVAVVLIVAAVNLVIYFSFIFLEAYPYTPQTWFSQHLVYYVSAATLLLIFGGSFYRWFSLRSGGHAVAAMVGAQRLDLRTSDIKQRRLINVVEEMSIASGVPLPTIYVMRDEPAINAFVAGYEPTQAVMVVTEGAIEQLDRNELQGVVAHEFSHILNGDMRINVKLIAVLAGILMITVAGRLLMQGSGRSRGRSSGGLVVLGLLLMLVGYIGVLGGRLIKAAVSRQREYLADAAAVQFTRQPRGIASALNKIRLAGKGSLLRNAHAEDMSHMCFSRALSQKFSGWMATHPPLEQRIRRVDPSFLSLFRAQQLSKAINEEAPVSQAAEVAAMPEQLSALAPMSAAEFAESAGQIGQSHIAYAAQVHEAFSDLVLSAAHEMNAARLLVFAMLLSKMSRETGLALLADKLQADEVVQLQRLTDELTQMEDRYRLPLLDLLAPSLQQLNEHQRRQFLATCEALIKCDQRYTLQEFVLLYLLEHQLAPTTGRGARPAYFSFSSLHDEIHLLLSLMVHAGATPGQSARQSYQRVATSFMLDDREVLEKQAITPTTIRTALERLGRLTPLLKKNIIEACADIAMHDRTLHAVEADFLRMIAESLDCPIPPLVASE